MPEMIRAEKIWFRYDEERPWAVADVDLQVQRGEFVAVLGANGCGKSTLAKHLNAILIPEKGTVWVEAMDTAEEDHIWDIRQKVGLVFQNPDNQIVATVVEEDVAFALENLGVPPDEMRKRIDDAMEATGIYKYRHRQPHKLSGGQKQRVAVAGVLAMQPDCLVLDEATAMLDPRGRDRIMRTVEQLNRERGITVVHITHYMEEAVRASRVLVMDKGRVAMMGTPKEVFSRVEELRALHMDVPQAAELCERLDKAGFAMPRGVIDVEECAQLLHDKLVEHGVAAASAALPEGGEQAGTAQAPMREDIAQVALPDTAVPAEAPPVQDTAGQSQPDSGAAHIIRVEDLSFVYNPGLPDSTEAIHKLNFEVEQHCFLGVIGPTGCGKSTLVTHLNGLLKPSSGKVFIDGQDIWANPKDIRRFRFMVGLVFQYPEYQLFEETVAKDIGFGPRNMGLSEQEIEERVRESAAFCGIAPEMLGRSPFELSGGQKRRVAIAGVIAMRPKLLVLDEPAAGLDPRGRETILSQISTFHKQTGTSVVLVSHSMEDVARYADKVLVMREGGIAMYDKTPVVFGRAAELLEMGLSVPQVTKIFMRLAQLGVDIDTDIYTVKYAAEMVLRRVGLPAGDKAVAGAARQGGDA